MDRRCCLLVKNVNERLCLLLLGMICNVEKLWRHVALTGERVEIGMDAYFLTDLQPLKSSL